MNILKLLFIKMALILLICFVYSPAIMASGIFSTGIGLGLSGDTGGLNSTISSINAEMRQFQIADPAISVSEIEPIYSPVIALNFSYIYNFAIFKAGWEYSDNIFFTRSGSIDDNNIDIFYKRFTFPVSAGIIIPFDRKNRFYFAGGLNYSYANLQIKQSDPGAVPGWVLPDEKYTFAADILGFHVKAGGEVYLQRNYTFVFEMTRYYGKEKKVDSEEENLDISLRLNNFQFTAGINYSVDI